MQWEKDLEFDNTEPAVLLCKDEAIWLFDWPSNYQSWLWSWNHFTVVLQSILPFVLGSHDILCFCDWRLWINWMSSKGGIQSALFTQRQISKTKSLLLRLTRRMHNIPESRSGFITLFLLVEHFLVSIKIVHVHFHLASEQPLAGRVWLRVEGPRRKWRRKRWRREGLVEGKGVWHPLLSLVFSSSLLSLRPILD